jgi:hypothetical protein
MLHRIIFQIITMFLKFNNVTAVYSDIFPMDFYVCYQYFRNQFVFMIINDIQEISRQVKWAWFLFRQEER